ncbi:MAG: hypothetical protein AAF483_28980 [Planctomycetota bacterium]
MSLNRFELGRRYKLLSLLTIACMLLCSAASAQKAPRSIAEMEDISDVILVGTIAGLRSESRPSRIESGFGNTDWVITLTLAVREVEVGDLSSEEVEVRCIRVRSRKSVFGLVSLTGHRPIPGIGSVARFYLKKDAGAWAVVMPNGIAAVTNDEDGGARRLGDATEVSKLGSPRYTFFLPIELWVGVAVLGILAIPVVRRFRIRN